MRLGQRRRGSGGGVSSTVALETTATSEIAGLTSAPTLTQSDLVLAELASGGAKRSATAQVIHNVSNTYDSFNAITANSTCLLPADVMAVEDASASNVKRKITTGDVQRIKLGSYTVAGSAKQTIVIGSGGDTGLTHISFATGRRYRIEARFLPTTVASTHVFSIDPASQTANLHAQYLGALSTGISGAYITSGNVWTTSTDVEEAIVQFEWNEMTGFDRMFEVQTAYYDGGASAFAMEFFKLFWAKTPAETAMTTMRLACTISDGMGIGSYLAVFDIGAC